MKKTLTFILVCALVACSKEEMPAPAPVNTAAKVTVISAAEKAVSGATMLEMTVDVKNSSYLSKAEIRTLSTSNSTLMAYNVKLQDGIQTILISKYSTSPANYQVKYTMKADGKVIFASIESVSY